MREFELLKHIEAANRRLPGHVIIPPGDDLAAVRLNREIVLAGMDQVVDGRHFRLRTTPLELIGRKAMTRSLSDAAAMASLPLCMLAAATLPPNFGEDRANALFDAMRATGDEFDAPLVGGDIAFHASPEAPLVISTTVIAYVAGRKPVTRSGAVPGDAVYVTGPLGGSLQMDGLGRHLTFEPRIRLAQQLLITLGEDRLHAMIDISDGLGRDASHIARMSGVQIILDAPAIPCNVGCDWRRALSDGEDHELLFCAPRDIPMRVDGVDLHRVGEVRKRPGDAEGPQPHVLVRFGQNLWSGDDLGWEHRGNSHGATST